MANRDPAANATSDTYGSSIDVRDLPRQCRPPYRGRTVWTGEHRGWRIVVTRIEHDPLAHVVVSGMHPASPILQLHAARRQGATAPNVRVWIDELLSSPAACSA